MCLAAFEFQGQNGVAVTETTWPAKPKIFALRTFTERFAAPSANEKDNLEKDHSSMMCERQGQGTMAEPGRPGVACVTADRAAGKAALVEVLRELRHEG